MGTRCFISMKENGRIKGVTCNYDGYIECAGMTQFLDFTDRDSLRRLIDHGDMSSLGTAVNNTAFLTGGNHGAREYRGADSICESESVEYAYVLDENRRWQYYRPGDDDARDLESDLRICCPGIFQIT